MRLARYVGLVALAALAVGCSRGGDRSTDPDGPQEPLRIRVIVKPNPTAGDVGAEFRLQTVPAGDEAPKIIYKQLMSASRTDTTVDVAGIDELAIHVDETHVFTVPRNFWETIIRGRLVLKLGPGGVRLTRSVKPTDDNFRCTGPDDAKTCWTTEIWYFPGGLWDEGADVAVPLTVRNRSNLETGAALGVQIFADEPNWNPVGETTFIGGAAPTWETTARLDPDATLTVVVGDAFVEIPPDVWQATWASATLEVTDTAVTFTSRWPNSARTLGRVTAELPLVPLP